LQPRSRNKKGGDFPAFLLVLRRRVALALRFTHAKIHQRRDRRFPFEPVDLAADRVDVGFIKHARDVLAEPGAQIFR